MWASGKGHEEIIRTLLEYKADVGTHDKVKNQMMMMMVVMMMMMRSVIDDENR
jgi:hypothetical protein